MIARFQFIQTVDLFIRETYEFGECQSTTFGSCNILTIFIGICHHSRLMEVKKKVEWRTEAAEKNIKNAEGFLRLTFSKADADTAAKKFEEHKSRIEYFKAKDILRSSELALLPPTDGEVKEKLERIKNGIVLNPILLVRDKHKLYIADGYHRVCASYHVDEAADVASILVHI